jgi:Zn-dependent peptidase ImmA (M78 family)
MTAEQLDEAARLRATGMTYSAIGERYGVTAKAIHNRLTKTGRVATTRKSTKSVTRWPDHVIADAHRRCVQGENRDAVAASLGISYEALRSAWCKRGLPALTKPRRWSKRAVIEAHGRYMRGEPKEDIATSMGVSWEHLYRAMRRIGLSTREFSVAARRYDDIGRRAYSLRMQGKMFKEIGEIMGFKTVDPAATAACAVYRYCRRYKIQKPDRLIATTPPSPREP